MNARLLLPLVAASFLCDWSSGQSGSFEYVHGSKVNRVLARSDLEVWTTLDGGVIRYSTDGGVTFQNATLPDAVRGNLEGICQVQAGGSTTMWAVGQHGVVLRSVDAGATWALQATISGPGGSGVYLRDVLFADTSNGLAVGDGDLIYYSADGGSTWTGPVVTGHFDSSIKWYRIHSFSSSEYFVVGTDLWVANINLAGSSTKTQILVDPLTWYPVQFPANGSWEIDLWDVEFDGSVGYTVGGYKNANGYAFRSTDYGSTWTLLTDCVDRSLVYDGWPGGVIPPTFWGVEMFGGQSDLAIAGYGSSVHVIPSNTVSGNKILPSSSTPQTCAQAGLQMRVCDQDDLSDLAMDDEDQVRPFLLDIEASDSGDVTWAVGDMGVVRVSSDRGETWSDVAGNHRTRIEGCDFASMSVGMAFGQLQRVMWTTDGGENWTLELDGGGGSPALRAGDISSLGVLAAVVGDDGAVALRDSGGSWSTQTLSGAPDLHSVAMTDDGIGIVACGDNGGVYTSTNSGATFTSSTLQHGGSGVTADLVQLIRIAGRVFYLASDNYIYIANEASHTSAYERLPLVDASMLMPSAAPTAFGIRMVGMNAQIMAGNEDGELFEHNAGKLHLVVASGGSLTPSAVVRVEPVPGNPDWFVGGANGDVLRFDGSSWSLPKTSMKTGSQPVNGLEFFPVGGGGFEGLLMSRRSTVCVWQP